MDISKFDFSALDAADAAPATSMDFSALDLPEDDASVYWGGRQVSKSAILKAAEQRGVSPDAIMRLDTWQGKTEDWLAKRPLGNVALRVTEGFQGVADTVVGGVARAAGYPDVARNVAANRRKREEFLSMVEKGGDIERTLGQRGARIFNNSVQSATEVGLVGISKAPLAVYSYVVGSEFERAMDDGEQHGLEGSDLVSYAGRRAAIEGTMSLLMGKLAKKAGAYTLAESVNPAAGNAIRKFLDAPDVKSKLVAASKSLGGMAAEGVEELLTNGAIQANDLSFGVRDGFDFNELLDAGLSGVTMRGISHVRDLHGVLNDFVKNKLPHVAEGTNAAMVDLERGVNPFLVKDLDGAEFDRQTGREGTTPEFRLSYRDALNHYMSEARANGETGSLERLERDALAIHEEERQRTARIQASKDKAAAQKQNGVVGESQVKVEPVEAHEQPSLTADQRATFNLRDFEALVVEPKIGEALTQPQPKVNPYLRAPWESETRGQRRVRRLSEQVETHKATIKTLRSEAVANKRLTREQQQAALELVRENIPAEDRHKYFQGVIESTRPSAINKLLDRVDTYIGQRDHSLAVQNLKESIRKATNLRPEFAQQVQKSLNSIDLKRFRHREVAETLRQWQQDNPQAIISPKEQGLIDRLAQQNIHSMTADDVRALASHVESLAYQSKLKDTLIGNAEAASVRDTADNIVREIATAPRKEMKSDSLLSTSDDNTTRTIGSLALHEVAERPEVTLRSLSSELSNQIYEPIRKARSRFKLRMANTRQFMSDLFNSVGLEHENSLAKSVAYRTGLPSTKLEGWRSHLREINGTRLTRGEALWLALSSKDPDGIKNLMEHGAELSQGRKLAPVDPHTLAHLFDFIGPEGETWVNGAFEHLNTYVIDGVNTANEKMTGRPLTEKRNVVPLVLADDDYAKLVSKGRAGEVEALADSYGHLKHREGGGRALRIPDNMDAIDMVMSHADRMHRFAEYSVPARNAELLLNDADLKQSIKEKNGHKGYDQIVDAVRSEVAGYPPVDGATKNIAALNHAAAGALIVAKIPVMAKQPLDMLVAAAMDEGGISHLGKGLDELAARGPAAVLTEMKSVLGQHSGEWQGRYEAGNYSGEVTSGFIRQRSHFRPSTLIEHGADSLQKAEMLTAAMPNYLAAKQAAREHFRLQAGDHKVYLDTPEWIEHVVDGWERKTVRGSNSSDGMELSGALRFAKKNPLYSLVANFYNQAGKIYSLFPMAQQEYQKGNHKRAGQIAATGLGVVLADAILSTALATGDQEKKHSLPYRTLARFVGGIASLFPAGGQELAKQVIAPAFGMSRSGGNPIMLLDLGIGATRGITSLATQLLADADRSLKPQDMYKAWIDIGYSAGPLLAIPTPGFIDLGKRIKAGTPFPGLTEAEPKPEPFRETPKRHRKSLSGLFDNH